MTSISQIIPYAIDENISEHYNLDLNETIEMLSKACNGLFLEIYPPDIHNPYPIGITLISFYIMKKVVEVIEKGIHSIVVNYFNDKRLHQQFLQLPLNAIEILKLTTSLPYKVGSWRPDILFPKNKSDSFVICEINARYPFNGYYASHFKNSTLSNLSHLKNIPIMPIQELEGVLNAFNDVFDPTKPVGILKSLAKDKGWDVNFFKKMFGSTENQQENERITSSSPSSLSTEFLSPEDNQVNIPPTLIRESSFPNPPTCKREFSQTFNVREDFARFIDPLNLILGEDGKIYDKSDFENQNSIPLPIQQFALEISQEELLNLPFEIVETLITKCNYINDLRTILIAHDKRLLSVLSSPDIMKDYLSPEEVAILQQHIIKTYICGLKDPEHIAAVQRAKLNRDMWLLKPNGGGKGIGIVFGRDCKSNEEWESILDNPDHEYFVLQEVVNQHIYSIYTKKRATSSSSSTTTTTTSQSNNGDVVKCTNEAQFYDMFVVGLLHCFNNKFLGPGIFRASSLESPIVNVAGGKGVILSPVVLSCKWPLARLDHNVINFDKPSLMFHPPQHCVFDLTFGLNNIRQNIINALNSDGISLIHTHWSARIDYPEKINDIMIEFIQSIGGLPHPHSEAEGGTDFVWDVKPVIDPSTISNSQSRPARSLTAEAFEMHTDCSFENPPPRFMCLYVMREDRLGGGHSLLLDTEVLIRYLSRRSLKTLLTSTFEMNVPDEFKKGRETIFGKLIWDDVLWRYRSDLIIRDKCTPIEIEALNELDELIKNPHLILATDLPFDSILVLDNSRWMHGRTVVLDHKRWLKRIRFHPVDLPPPCKRLISRSRSLQFEEDPPDNIIEIEISKNETDIY